MKKRHGNVRHGHATKNSRVSTTYVSWSCMKGRCLNPGDSSYDRYGGRGISICRAWQNSFEQFLSDMGERPDGKTLDRIDVNGNYEPSNCRWATPSEQSKNSRRRRLPMFRGAAMPFDKIAKLTGIREGTLRIWDWRGLSLETKIESFLRHKLHGRCA